MEPRPIAFAGFRNADAPPQDLISRCVHCGLCLPTCPTFAELGVEMDSPRGRIRLMKSVWDGRIDVRSDGFDEHMYKCLDCRACETACPSGVEFGKLMEGARSQVEAARHRPPQERLLRWVVFHQLITRPGRLAAFARLGYVTKRLGGRWLLRRVGFRRLAELLSLVPDAAPTSAALPERFEATPPVRGRVALFTGCVMRSAFAATNAATARVLARNGIGVVVPTAQTCCGALHAHAGERNDARALAKRNIADLEPLEVDAFVVNAAGCGANLKEYGWLLKDDPAWAERAHAFSARVRDASEYLADIGLAAAPGPLAARAAYDDPCHLLHGQKIKTQPRALLAAIPGLELVPLGEADWCCGSAGTYNVTQPELAARLGHRKAEHVVRSGAEIIVTANPGCQMQIASALRDAGSAVQVVHLMDLLDRAYASADRR
ncbi:MAG TPA: heterodisulfide reductase-related iron-sulfur binding cluster [Candidatus Saccharimonadales bacterium]|nr:heterodisulfide reductase-related iron-sulfur binding cluster [Candidatus Saccharimonadales bacterium]